jgi:hypothetical protein
LAPMLQPVGSTSTTVISAWKSKTPIDGGF